MPTVTSRVSPLIDYLVGLFTGAATLGQATPPVAVYDGPQVTLAPAQRTLWVGVSDPDSSDPAAAAEFTQDWAGMGRRGRNEMVTVHCCADAWSGTTDVKTARDAVTGIVAAVEALMQADTTGFGGNVLFPDPGIAAGQLLQANTEAAAFARVPFDIVFKSRIGG